MVSAVSSRSLADSLKLLQDLNSEESQSQRHFWDFLFGWFLWELFGFVFALFCFVCSSLVLPKEEIGVG